MLLLLSYKLALRLAYIICVNLNHLQKILGTTLRPLLYTDASYTYVYWCIAYSRCYIRTTENIFSR